MALVVVEGRNVRNCVFNSTSNYFYVEDCRIIFPNLPLSKIVHEKPFESSLIRINYLSY